MIDRRALLALAGAGLGTALLPRAVLARGPDAYPPPDREQMVPTPAGRLYVRVNGRLDGPRLPVVFIHGGPGGNHAAFLNALPMASERTVVLYDQLDCGRSDSPGDPANWTVPRFVDEVEAVRAALAIPRWHVSGHSWGGTVALEYAARRPSALAGLVLAGPLVATKAWLADAAILRARLPRGPRETLMACEGTAPPPAAACDAATDAFYAAYNRRDPATLAMKAYRATFPRSHAATLYHTMWGASEFVSTGTLRSYDGTALLSRLDGRRTLMIAGEHDEARPATVRRFARMAGAAYATVPAAAHGIFNDNPEATRAMLSRFFEAVERA